MTPEERKQQTLLEQKAGRLVVEYYDRVDLVDRLHEEKKIAVHHDPNANETVVKFGDMELRDPDNVFPSEVTATQLILLFG